MKNVNMPYEEPSNEREFQKPAVSNAVIRRLPRYFRYLRELMRQGKTRTSLSLIHIWQRKPSQSSEGSALRKP